MTPAFPTRLLLLGVFDTIYGAILATQAESRSSSRAYALLRQVRPVDQWGLVLFFIGLLLLIGVALHASVTPQINRGFEAVLGILAAGWCAYWATTLLQTAAEDPRVSFGGCAVWYLITAKHLALAFGREG